jgi:hypothetical protein
MTIYAIDNILSSKPHNPHYLNRYIRFIESCRILNEDYTGYTEKHHICPKSLFPEYKSLSKHSWNLVVLTPRQHFIAHHLLWKAYPEMKSMSQAFFLMSHTKGNKLDSRTYSRLSEENSKNSSESARKRVANGTHNLLGGEIQRESALKRVSDKTHNLLGGEMNRKRIADKTHHLLGGEMQRKRVSDKTHHLLGGEIQRESNRKRVTDKTHHLLGGEIQRKRVREGTHNCLGSVACYDKQGTFVRVPKEIYHSQTGPMEDRDYVHNRTKEAKRRKALRLPV